MARKLDTQKLIAEFQQKLIDCSTATDRLVERRKVKLLADIDAGEAPDTRQIDAEISAQQKEQARLKADIEILEGRAADEQKQQVAKQRLEHIEKVAALFSQRTENGRTIEKAVAVLVKAVGKDLDLSAAIGAAEAWDSNRWQAIKLGGPGIKQLLAVELYRQSATKFLGNAGDNAVVLPGSVCPREEWRRQPSAIPPLVRELEEIEKYAFEAMQSSPVPTPRAPATAALQAPQFPEHREVVTTATDSAPKTQMSAAEAMLNAQAEADANRPHREQLRS